MRLLELEGNWAILGAIFRNPPLCGRGWRVAMGRGDVLEEKVRENREIVEEKRGWRRRQAQWKHGRRVSQRGCWCWTGKESGDLRKRRGGIIIVQARTRSSPPTIRWNEATQDAGQQWSRPSHSAIDGMESLLMARRATNQNLFVVLLPPVRRLSLGGEKNIYISIFYPKCATCALFFLEEYRANIEKTGSNSAFSSRISWIEKNSWAEITDIDNGRRMITMMTRRVERDEFGVTKFAGKKKKKEINRLK